MPISEFGIFANSWRDVTARLRSIYIFQLRSVLFAWLLREQVQLHSPTPLTRVPAPSPTDPEVK